MNLTDEQLMQLYQAGEVAAFNELYARYARKIYGYLHRHGLQNSSADEVFQQVFLKLHRSLSAYSDKYKFAAWLFTICRNTVIDHYRSLRDHVEFNETQHLLGIEPTINSDLTGLNAKEAFVVTEHYLNQKSYEEIAVATGSSAISLRKLASRALAKLRGKSL